MNVAPSLEHAAGAAVDPRIAVAEARLVMLREVAEFGVTRIRERYARPGEDPVIACGRFSRAIRCALILESIIEVELAALKAGTWMPPSPDPAGDPEPSKDKDMSAPKDLVERESPDRETFGHILKLPFKDALKWICKELGMDGDEFLRNHPLTPVACPDAASTPAPPPAPTPTSSDEVRDEVRERVVQAINTELDLEEEIDIAEAENAVRTLDEHLYDTRRYDAVIRRPLTDAVSAILSDLGFNPRRTGEDFPASAEAKPPPGRSREFASAEAGRLRSGRPPPDPPPRMDAG